MENSTKDKTFKKSSHSNCTHQLCKAVSRVNRQEAACIDKETHDNCAISREAWQPKTGQLHKLDLKVITTKDRLNSSDHYQSDLKSNVLYTMVQREPIEHSYDEHIEASYMIPYPEPRHRQKLHQWCLPHTRLKQKWSIYSAADYRRQPTSLLTTT